MKTAFVLFILLFSISFADTYNQTFTSGKAGTGSPPIDIDLRTDMTIDLNASSNQSSYLLGKTANITFGLINFFWGATNFKAIAYIAANARPISNGSLGAANINFVNTSTFEKYTDYYRKCKYPSTPTVNYSCINNEENGVWGTGCSYGDNWTYCNVDLLRNAKYSANRTVVYYNGTYGNGIGEITVFCNGKWYIDGKESGEILESNGSAIITLPGTPQNYSVNISARYSCLFVLNITYVIENNQKSDKSVLYYNPSAHTSTTNITILTNCSYANMTILGVEKVPIVFANNSAKINISVQNTGSAKLRVLGLNATDSNFQLDIQGQLIEIEPNGINTFNATLNYTGMSLPSNITIIVSANATEPVCNDPNVTSSITVKIDNSGKGNLITEIYPEDDPMNPAFDSSANITVINSGVKKIDNETILNVKISHCNDLNLTNCPGSEDETNYTIYALESNENETRSVTYNCKGYDYVGIIAMANAEKLDIEDNFYDNKAKRAIQCSRESCVINGPSEIITPKQYNFSAVCKEGMIEKDCDNMLKHDFYWQFNPPSSPVFMNYTVNSYGYGIKGTNNSVNISEIFANGLFNITANSKTNADKDIKCTYSVPVFQGVCIAHI